MPEYIPGCLIKLSDIGSSAVAAYIPRHRYCHTPSKLGLVRSERPLPYSGNGFNMLINYLRSACGTFAGETRLQRLSIGDNDLDDIDHCYSKAVGGDRIKRTDTGLLLVNAI